MNRLLLWADGVQSHRGHLGDWVEHISELFYSKGEERIFIFQISSLKGCWLLFEHELPKQTEHIPVGRGSPKDDSCRY